MSGESSDGYARLPDELLEDIMGRVGRTVSGAKSLVSIEKSTLDEARSRLVEAGLIKTVDLDGEFTDSIIAVDGGMATDRLDSMDVSAVHAAGVVGLKEVDSVEWGKERHQYITWQAALPHSDTNRILTKGIMMLAEMIVLVNAKHDIRLLDGSHIYPVIELNALLTANSRAVSAEYMTQMAVFLSDNGMGVEDIPDILREIMHNPSIVASTKYNSSSEIVDGILGDLDIKIDDKFLFSHILRAGEYLDPRAIGNDMRPGGLGASSKIGYSLRYPDINPDDFKWYMNEAIVPIKTVDMSGAKRSADVYYTYYRAFDESPVCRLEVKREVAKQSSRLEKVLRSIGRQTVYPHIIEPYPQFLADKIAKSTGIALRAIRESVMLSTKFSGEDEAKYFLRNYRT